MKTVLAHITQRGSHWLVRITAAGLPRPIWRKYSRETHTEAEAVMLAARHVGCPGEQGAQVRVCWRGWMG